MPIVVAVGDLMFGRGVDAIDPDALGRVISPAAQGLLTGDLVTGNLECVVGEGGDKSPFSHSHFRTSVERAAVLLKHFDVVSLANNHAFDFGPAGVADTRASLDALEVRHVGSGRTREEASRPAVFDVGGREVAVLGATTVSVAPQGLGGWVLAKPDHLLRDSISRCKAAGQVVVLHLHAGGGDCVYPAPAVRRLHHEMMDWGADIVLGHHPHVVQGWMEREEKHAFFSLGDFVFDKLEDGRDRSLIVRIDLAGERPEVDVAPVRRMPSLEVAPVSGSELDPVLSELKSLGEALASGESDAAYNAWYGNPAGRLWRSVRKDFEHGGVPAIIAKFQRLAARRFPGSGPLSGEL